MVYFCKGPPEKEVWSREVWEHMQDIDLEPPLSGGESELLSQKITEAIMSTMRGSAACGRPAAGD